MSDLHDDDLARHKAEFRAPEPVPPDADRRILDSVLAGTAPAARANGGTPTLAPLPGPRRLAFGWKAAAAALLVAGLAAVALYRGRPVETAKDFPSPKTPAPAPRPAAGPRYIAYAPMKAMDLPDFIRTAEAEEPVGDQKSEAKHEEPDPPTEVKGSKAKSMEPEPPAQAPLEGKKLKMWVPGGRPGKNERRRDDGTYLATSVDVDGPFTVHEWGVIGLDARGLHDPAVALSADLPEYIRDADPATVPDPEYRPPQSEAKKPILYFYPEKKSPKVFQISAAATFAAGRPVYAWPPAFLKENRVQWAPVRKAADPRAARKVPKGHWIETARATDALWLQANGETERFLFYDGTTELACPFTFREAGDSIEIAHAGKSPAHDAFLIERKDKELKVGYLAGLDPGKSATIKAERAGTGDEAPEKKLAARLADAGLFRKEADGMARIWREDFFERPGRWIVWRLDPAAVDRLVPLDIRPKPKETVRVLLVAAPVATDLGDRVKALVEKLGSADYGTRESAEKEIQALGPFASAHLLAHEKDADPEIAARVQEIIERLGRPE